MKKNVQRLLTISILTSMTGAGIFAINKLINASAVIRNALHNKSQYFYDWKFGRIHYAIEGSGSPLLLLHDLSPASIFRFKITADSIFQLQTFQSCCCKYKRTILSFI